MQTLQKQQLTLQDVLTLRTQNTLIYFPHKKCDTTLSTRAFYGHQPFSQALTEARTTDTGPAVLHDVPVYLFISR